MLRIGAAVVATGLLAWWLVAEWGSPGSPDPQRSDLETDAGGAAAPVGADVGEDGEAAVAGRAESLRRAVDRDDLPGDAPRTATFAVQIVRDLGDGSGEHGVPGAVAFWESGHYIPEEEMRRLYAELGDACDDVEVVARHRGVEVVADAEGWIALPAATDHVKVFARHGEWTGRGFFPVKRGAPTVAPVLRLGRELAVRVFVRTADRTPLAGVKVDLNYVQADGSLRTVRERHSDRDGYAVFRHAHVLPDIPEILKTPSMAGSLRARAEACGVIDAPTADVPADKRGVAELELEMPALGYLDIGSQTIAGDAVGMRGAVIVRPAEGAPEAQVYHRLIDAPSHRFAVSLGRRFRATALLSTHQTGKPTLVREVDGPKALGETVTVRFVVGDDEPILVGRIVDPRRLPIAGALDLYLRRVGEVGWADHYQTSVAPDGRFCLTVDSGWLHAGPVECQCVMSAVPARTTLKLRDLDGTNRLGDVVLEATPMLVSGVVMLDGAPGWSTPALVVVKDGDRWEPVTVHDLSFRFDHGRFSIFGTVAPGLAGATDSVGFHVAAYAGERSLPRRGVPFVPGQTDLVVELTSGGDASIRLTGAAAQSAGAVRGRLVPVAGPAADDPELAQVLDGVLVSWAQRVERDLGDGCELRWTRLPPGDYRLDVLVVPALEPVASVGPFTVVAGVETEWPTVDLTSELATADVEVQIDGVAAAAGDEVVMFSEARPLVPMFYPRAGSAWPLPEGRELVHVVAPKCSPRSVQLVPGKQIVSLRRWTTRWEFELPPALRAQLPGVTWRVVASNPAAAAPGLPAQSVIDRLREHEDAFGRTSPMGDYIDAAIGRVVATLDEHGRGSCLVPTAQGWTLTLVGERAVDGEPVEFESALPGVWSVGATRTSLSPTPTEIERAAKLWR